MISLAPDRNSRKQTVSPVTTAAILKADGYDSDKDVNLNNPIINQESLEVDED